MDILIEVLYSIHFGDGISKSFKSIKDEEIPGIWENTLDDFGLLLKPSYYFVKEYKRF